MGHRAETMLSRPLDLPCGVQLKNRMVKSAMSDSLGDGAGNPTSAQIRLYERWAEGGTALSLIGEVQVSPHYPEKPGNLVLTEGANPAALTELAKRGAKNGAQIWPQLGHAGALAYAPVSVPKGPSPLAVEGLKCDGLSLAEIQQLPDQYASAARLAKKLGFGGVMIHAGHGFLLSQFLSPLFNKRTDAYGGSCPNRSRLIVEIIDAIRDAAGPSFPVSIRINSTDKLKGGLTSEDSLKIVALLGQTTVDLIDISGGTYFPGAPASGEGVSETGPYFADFAKAAKQLVSTPVMLTGGFRNHQQAGEVIGTGTADAVGLARLMVLDPATPDNWQEGTRPDPGFPRFQSSPPGGITAWYTLRMAALGRGDEATFDMTPEQALEIYNQRDNDRSVTWRDRFGPPAGVSL